MPKAASSGLIPAADRMRYFQQVFFLDYESAVPKPSAKGSDIDTTAFRQASTAAPDSNRE